MQPQKEILLVEDDIAHRTMLRLLLERRYAVFEVGDGAAAIETVQKHSFDLVLMDVRMPKISGIEALEKIRALAICRQFFLHQPEASPRRSYHKLSKHIDNYRENAGF